MIGFDEAPDLVCVAKKALMNRPVLISQLTMALLMIMNPVWAASAKVDPCSYYLKPEAESLLKAPVVVNSKLGKPLMCQYIARPPHIGTVTIQMYAGDGSHYEDYVKKAERQLAVKSTPIKGLGSQAVYNGTQLIVLQKNDFFIVTMASKKPQQQIIDDSTLVAKAVLSRM